MQDEFLVHTREGQDCPRCGGRITRIVVSGRSTYFCADCQVRLRRRAQAATPRARRDERGERRRRCRRRASRSATGPTPRRGPAARSSCRRPGRARRRRRARRRAGHARDRDHRPAREPRGGDRGPVHRRQRPRPRRRRRRDALVRGAGARLRDARRPRAARAGRGDLRPDGRRPSGPARARCRATPPARRRAAASPSAGSVGAGRGAAVAKMLRPRARRARAASATRRRAPAAGETVAALAVVNATGDVIGEDGSLIAGPRGDDGEMLRERRAARRVRRRRRTGPRRPTRKGTTLVCVMTDARARQASTAQGGADGERRRRPGRRPGLHAVRRRRRLLPRLRRADRDPLADDAGSARWRRPWSPRRSATACDEAAATGWACEPCRSRCSASHSSSTFWGSRSSWSRCRASAPISRPRRNPCNPIVTAYALCFGGFLVLGGRAADSLGGGGSFAAGLVLFAAASLIARLGREQRIADRRPRDAGPGAAAVVPAALSMVTSLYPRDRSGRGALAIWTAVAAREEALGFVLGGDRHRGGRLGMAFLGQRPARGAGVALTPVCSGAMRRESGWSAGLDLVGALLLSGGIGALIFAADAAGKDDSSAA